MNNDKSVVVVGGISGCCVAIITGCVVVSCLRRWKKKRDNARSSLSAAVGIEMKPEEQIVNDEIRRCDLPKPNMYETLTSSGTDVSNVYSTINENELNRPNGYETLHPPEQRQSKEYDELNKTETNQVNKYEQLDFSGESKSDGYTKVIPTGFD